MSLKFLTVKHTLSQQCIICQLFRRVIGTKFNTQSAMRAVAGKSQAEIFFVCHFGKNCFNETQTSSRDHFAANIECTVMQCEFLKLSPDCLSIQFKLKCKCDRSNEDCCNWTVSLSDGAMFVLNIWQSKLCFCCFSFANFCRV